MLWKMEKAIRVVGDIYGGSLASSLDGLHPMAHNEPTPIRISSLRAKDPVGSNMDEIGEESLLLICPPPVKRPSNLHTNRAFDDLGLI